MDGVISAGGILGLDVSTTCTGICIINKDKPAVHDFIKLTSTRLEKSLLKKADAVRDVLEAYAQTYEIKKVVIEQSLLRMSGGRSSAYTINMLSRFNGIISFIAYDVFGIEPDFIEARSARKRIGISIPKGVDPKPVVVDFLMHNYNFRVEYTKSGNIVPAYFDMADAYVVALSAAKLLSSNSSV